jgi:hypothetical protein
VSVASCFSKYHAIISGTAIFMNSEGWIVATPKFSQRRAPWLISPNSATPTSNAMPAK